MWFCLRCKREEHKIDHGDTEGTEFHGEKEESIEHRTFKKKAVWGKVIFWVVRLPRYQAQTAIP
jgi:hypothetical protein